MAENYYRPSVEAQKNILQFVSIVLADHKKDTELRDKMTLIDQAYARYLASNQEDSEAGSVNCDIFVSDNIVAPVVVSQVDSLVAYLADVYLSGSPLFPVVSTPTNRQYAEELEALIDDHSALGGYVRQLLLMFRDGAKYNYSGLEVDWTSLDQFSIADDVNNIKTARRLDRTPKFFNAISRIDPYNLIRDRSVLPGEVAEHGDFVGKIERLSYMRMRRYLKKLQDNNWHMNLDRAMASNVGAMGDSNYYESPQISNYMSATRKGSSGIDWVQYLSNQGGRKRAPTNAFNEFERVTVYARILPGDFAIGAPQPNTPQIWKFSVINSSIVVEARRIVSAFDYLPILIGQPLEDGLGYQTQSLAEEAIPIQEGATTLYNIRFQAARRAVSDRALYNPDYVKPSDVNSPTAAPKIPVSVPKLVKVALSEMYYPIPFDMRGTESTFRDAKEIVEFSKQLKGISNPIQGQFQKGNKSVTEWNDTVAGSDNRLRLPALCYEMQVFSPLKSMMALNIFQYAGDEVAVVSQKSGKTMKIDINKLRKQVLSFKIADGYTPKSKLASTEMLTLGMQTIGNSPLLQQAYGAHLPGMFAHMMSLGGVKGLDEYNPQVQAQATQEALMPSDAMQANVLGPGTMAPPMQPPPMAPLDQQSLPPA